MRQCPEGVGVEDEEEDGSVLFEEGNGNGKAVDEETS